MKAVTDAIVKEAKKRYNSMMNDFGMEYLTIGTNYSQDTDNWNLRDMVSECQYQLNVCYEDDNANSEGRSISDYLDMYSASYAEAEAEAIHKEWLSKTQRLRNFIKKYSEYCEDIRCASGHCSKFD